MSLEFLQRRLLTNGISSHRTEGTLIVEAAGDQAYTTYKRLHPNTRMTRQEYNHRIGDARNSWKHHNDKSAHHSQRAGHHHKQNKKFSAKHLRMSEAEKHGLEQTSYDAQAKHHKDLHSHHRRRAKHHGQQAENYLRKLNKLQNPGWSNATPDNSAN